MVSGYQYTDMDRTETSRYLTICVIHNSTWAVVNTTLTKIDVFSGHLLIDKFCNPLSSGDPLQNTLDVLNFHQIYFLSVHPLRSPNHCVLQTHGKTVATMQTIDLPYDSRGYREINTILWASCFAAFTANTFLCDEIALFFFFRIPNGKGGPLNRFSGKIKPFAASFVKLKNCKDLARFFSGIDFVHIWIFNQGTVSVPPP